MRMGEGIAAMDGEDLARRMQNMEEGIRNLQHMAFGVWDITGAYSCICIYAYCQLVVATRTKRWGVVPFT